MGAQPTVDEALDLARRYADCVRREYPVESVFLFGPYAQGIVREDSDIHIAVVSSAFSGVRMRDNIPLAKLRRAVDVRIDPLAFRPEQFNEDDAIAGEVLRTGIKVYPEDGKVFAESKERLRRQEIAWKASRPSQKEIEEIVLRFVARIRREIPVQEAYIFGSYAHGDPIEQSDLDVAIVSTALSGVRFHDNVRLAHLAREIDLRIEPLGFRPEDFNADHIMPAEILRTGIRIYPPEDQAATA